MEKIPKRFLKSKFRKEMWCNSYKILKKIEKILPVSSVYVLGSFTSKKKRPADVDFIILLKTKESNKSNWSADIAFVPDNKYGEKILKDASLWVKQKYGAKKFAIIKLK
jgi:hypothetical protein